MESVPSSNGLQQARKVAQKNVTENQYENAHRRGANRTEHTHALLESLVTQCEY